jgi:hypothetical protein
MPVMLNYNPNFLKVAKLTRRSVIGRLGPEGYVDSDFVANLDKRISLIGYVFINERCTVSLRACLQSTIAQSTNEVEYIAVYDACKEVV